MPSFTEGSLNVLALNNPGVYVGVQPPTPNPTIPSSNIEAFVGVASWGPVDSVVKFSSPAGCAIKLGVPQVRSFDIASYAEAAYQMGAAAAYAAVRVTDGTDTAATCALPNNAGEATAFYTGSLGNQIQIMFQPSAAAGGYSAIVSFPGLTAQRYDNIQQAVSAVDVTAGSGYAAVPSAAVAAPTGAAGAVPAVIQPTLAAVSGTVVAGGTGFAVNDTVTLGNGVVIKVLTVNSGAIATFSITNPGKIVSGAVPSTVGYQTATSGAGTGAKINLTWGLGTPTIVNPGYGYTAAPAIVLTGGSPTVAGSLTAVVSFWAALAYALANGTTQTGPSKLIIFTPGTSTAVPVTGTAYSFSGGTDGAAGVTEAELLGQDTAPRTGMYALRSSGFDAFTICDLVDETTWATQYAFAQSEAGLAVVADTEGDSIEQAVSDRSGAGVDSSYIWIIDGDYPTFYDTQLGYSRIINPCAIALGLLGNLSPEQSPINKELPAVIATISSQSGIIIADADESVAQNGGIDLIGQSVDLAEDYFSFLTGRNASSNSAANGVEYTRLTNFLVKLLEQNGKSVVGRLQSIQVNDPTRAAADATISSALQALASPNAGSNGYGMIDAFSTQCDLNNNPPNLQAMGFLFLYVKVRYLNVVRYFVVQLSGGGNVTVSVQSNQPSPSQFQ